MEIRILGSLSVTEGDVELIPSAPKLRQILALLLFNESHVVPTGSLLTELWDESPPRSAMTTLQTHVLRFRVMLAERLGLTPAAVAGDILQTRRGGYRLTLGATSFDLREYRELEALGAEALRAGDRVAASHRFAEALDQWRGPALLDVAQGRLLRAAVARLDESRLNVLRLLLDAQLSEGRHREVLSVLARLVVHHPFDQGLHGQFMVALHRSGYRARALEVFARLREDMFRELGGGPSAELVRLRHMIRVSDASILEGRMVPAAGA
ncbi:AfsR/SARP family transcriptional regulator [Actinomadura oligospora]|uniref:AfsR/SARP family transcriptional regulator n=1 Tax=Actinomadura oligospora TaxID=111804 RepID=UPI00047E1479|nr:AfsR/SARP family transcriptional regulator [Actinomadura oligospora]